MRRRGARAALVLLPTLDERKQQALLLRRAAEHGYLVTSMTSDPDAAAALAEAGLIDVIMLIRCRANALEMSMRAELAGVAVDEVRPREGAEARARAQIRDAARRGVPDEAIALVLDVPLARVLEVLGSTPSSGPRPRALPGPQA